MKTLLIGISLISTAVFAAKGTVSRGGLGFLFPDTNSFTNPGNFVNGSGTSVEVGYGLTSGSTTQSLGASAIYGRGKFGLGAYFSRSSTDLILTSAATDSAGAGLGVSLFKEQLNLGAGYSRSVTDSTDPGSYNVALSWQPKGKGFGIGAGVSSTLATTPAQTGVFSLGYQFSPAFSAELDWLFSAWTTDAISSGDPAGYIKVENGRFYLSAGDRMTLSSSSHLVSLRLGALVTQKCDISLYGNTVLTTGGATSFGATGRIVF